MGKRIKKLKKIRIHREGTDTLVFSAVAIVAIALLLWYAVPTKVPFWGFVAVFAIIYGVVLNFYRCPKRFINLEDTDNSRGPGRRQGGGHRGGGRDGIFPRQATDDFHFHESFQCTCQLVSR